MDRQWIEMAALGRPLYAGMLYDCRNDSYIPGVTLWDSEALKKDLDTHVKPNTTFNISTSDSIGEKAKLLEMSSSLKASVMGGLVEVCGSAQYLKDQTSSLLQSRIALQYGQTVRFEQLTMTHLGQVKYPQVFEQKSATHVVVAVLFGAQAFFVFDKQTLSAESKRKMDVKLQGMLRKMPQLSIDWDGAVAKFSANEREELKTFSCTFYGDYQLKKLPTNFEEAVEIYNSLPTMLGDKGETAVPIRVWLLPLATLEPRAARLEHMISSMGISEVESAIEDLRTALLQCSDLLQDPLLNLLGCLKERLTHVQQQLQHYQSSFRRTIARLLRTVRGGEQREAALDDALDAHQRSPFGRPHLQRWLNERRSETKVLELYVRSLSNKAAVCSSQQLEEFCLDPQKDTIISFSFTSVDREDPYLHQIESYLDHHQQQEQRLAVRPQGSDATTVVDHAATRPTVSVVMQEEKEKLWFLCNQISKRMREKLHIFQELMQANRGEGVRFIACSRVDTEFPGADIHVFHRGIRVLPLALDVPQQATVEELQRTSVTLRLPTKPPAGTVRYRLELAERCDDQQQPSCGEKWTTTETRDTPQTWTYSDLNQRRVYLFRYRPVTEVLVGLASKVTQFQTKGFFDF